MTTTLYHQLRRYNVPAQRAFLITRYYDSRQTEDERAWARHVVLATCIAFSDNRAMVTF
jgi:hypothetical protein